MISDVIRPMHLKKMNAYVVHKESITNVNLKKNNDTEESRYIEFNQVFKKNEYVIHEDYGLGIYDSLEIVEANNEPSEYLKIIYANNENLYVPLNNINKISSYHKRDNLLNLDLDSLSSTKWLLKKEKAQKRSIDHAAEILDVESRRSKSFSTSLTVDTKSLIEFENDFPFTPTPDQIIAFEAIKKDISLIKPMNRVLCGDVGFGKTEVAMKAAFISVNANKQVIVVTPSTILCDQHYDSFLKRYTNFGVTIKKLNRFVSNKDKNKIIDDFNLGNIDILISTHIIFSNDINFNNTGLLVIDEEHKFGIKQKNFIKDKQENIHILYLSATPIPRTMNMVFSGLKDFSFLQTAPSNRLSIKSFLKVQTNQLIKEALTREKNRGGQCFIVQNDIDKIQNIKNEINYLLPEFKLGIAHGRLSKKEIKKVMTEFKSGLLDGLICTTIVEMGLDIPNANTMMIINSQKFGLSQLHQLRGRIGRSYKQAYCYFLIPDIEIPKISKARLDSIIRNSNLGEGFLIAQEDLEIRGGGEMLGDKQSGHINSVGMSLYLSMLKKAIETNKNNIEVNNHKPDINFYDSSFISSSYLPSPVERLKVYRKLDEAESFETIIKIKDDLIDRCGVMPDETKNLIEDKKIQIRVYKSGIKSIKSNNTNTNFHLSDTLNDNTLENLLSFVTKDRKKYLINKESKFIYKYNESDSKKRRKSVNLLLDEIL
jgi:transcription-repair coupling factor (superfamily II helicase)